MRRVIVSINVTLDGFVSGPKGELDWHFPLWNEEMSGSACEQLQTMDTILMGRITYQSMSRYWPGAAPTRFGNMMNSFCKVVFSSTLQKTSWNNSRIAAGNVALEVNRLKKMPGKNMIVYGSISIVDCLKEAGLIDEYRIWVHPVVIGKGKPLFNLHDHLSLQLLRSKTFGSGVIVLYYQPKNPAFAAVPSPFLA
ncbi:MAG: dihydrofolate reductase [Williamsia sp.]|nr:dihydrofolate reductase [Williamsia sp.]